MQRQRRSRPPHRRDEPDLDERAHPARAAAAVGDLPPGDASHHRRDVDREVRDRGSQLRVTRRADGGDDVREQRREHDDVAGRDREQRGAPGARRIVRNGRLTLSTPGASSPARTRTRARSPRPAPSRALSARTADRVEAGVRDGGDRPAERESGLAHAQGPAPSGRRVGDEQGSGTRHRGDRRAQAEHHERHDEGRRRRGRTRRPRARAWRSPSRAAWRGGRRAGRRRRRHRSARGPSRAGPAASTAPSPKRLMSNSSLARGRSPAGRS